MEVEEEEVVVGLRGFWPHCPPWVEGDIEPLRYRYISDCVMRDVCHPG